MQRYVIAAGVCLSLLPAARAGDGQATPGQPEQKPKATVPEKTPAGDAKAEDGLPGIRDMLPDAGLWDGMKEVMAEVLWTAKMALVGIVVVLALAILGKIFVFMHK
jgi:hypothetical protein